jgi:hypothetical protein
VCDLPQRGFLPELARASGYLREPFGVAAPTSDSGWQAFREPHSVASDAPTQRAAEDSRDWAQGEVLAHLRTALRPNQLEA